MKKPNRRPRGVHLTIAAAALEIGVARETLRTRVVSAGLAPASSERGSDTYRLRALLRAWYAPAEADPAKLSAFARRAHFQAQHEEMRLAERAGSLIPRSDVEREFAHAFAAIARSLATLPDRIERILGSSAAELAETEMKQLRRELVDVLRQPELPVQ